MTNRTEQPKTLMLNKINIGCFEVKKSGQVVAVIVPFSDQSLLIDKVNDTQQFFHSVQCCMEHLKKVL